MNRMHILLGILTIAWTSVLHAHTWDEVQTQYQRMGIEPSAEIEKLTRAWEGQPLDSLVREQLHAAQHQMLLDAQEAVNKSKCVDLLAKLPALDRRIDKLRSKGESSELDKLEKMRDEADAFSRVHCNYIQ